MDYVPFASIFCAAFAVAFGATGPALAAGHAVAAAMDAISRTLFAGLAMIETTAIYCLMITLLLLFAKPLLA